MRIRAVQISLKRWFSVVTICRMPGMAIDLKYSEVLALIMIHLLFDSTDILNELEFL
jgi:hypothetical protein